jgi:hypothetical protein
MLKFKNMIFRKFQWMQQKLFLGIKQKNTDKGIKDNDDFYPVENLFFIKGHCWLIRD